MSRLREYLFAPENHPGEKKLVRKIDFFILTFCCLMYVLPQIIEHFLNASFRYFMNYLDRSNLTAAYVSGMKTDLHFQGNQFNVINTLFTVGYTMLVGLDLQQDTTY